MKKEKSIQADIEETLEVLEQIQSSVEFYEKDKPEFVEALSSAISALEAMRDASDMLPEKKLFEDFEDNSKRDIKRAFNQAIDLCQPVASKLLEENKELRKKIKELENA